MRRAAPQNKYYLAVACAMEGLGAVLFVLGSELGAQMLVRTPGVGVRCAAARNAGRIAAAPARGAGALHCAISPLLRALSLALRSLRCCT